MLNVIGIENVDYVSKKTNNRVQGKRIYYVEDLLAGKGEGSKADNVFVRDEDAAHVCIGDCIEVYYNKFGTCVGIKVI